MQVPLSKALHDFMFIDSTDPRAFIITSNHSFLEFLDPKDEGSKLLWKVSIASHLKDSNLHQHYHQNPKFHNAMNCFTYHTIIWIKVFMLWLPLYTIWGYWTKPDAKIKSANYISEFQFLAQARIVIFAAIFRPLTEIIQWQHHQACPWQHALTTLLPPLPSP